MTIPAARINDAYANAAAIKAIPPNERQDGDSAFNAGTGVSFHFDAESSAGASASVLVPDAGTGRWIADTTIAGAADTTTLASTANGEGASTVGIEDSGSYFTGTTVEAALAETETRARLSSTANGKGASLVGSEDAGGFTAQTTVEGQLQEIYQDLKTTKLIVPVYLEQGILAAGTPLAAWADDAGASSPGVTLVNSKAVGVRWNNFATQIAVWAPTIYVPYDADVSANATLRILCSKVGATSGDATTFTVTAFANAVGALHDADADFGGTSSAITGNATSKTIQQSTLTLALADLAAAAAPAGISMSIKPTNGTLGTDDMIVHAVFIEFKRKLRTS